MAGEKTAVELALEASDAPFSTAEQLDMLGLTADPKVVVIATAREAKIGRPLGARNRRTVEMASYLLSRYTSPLEILAQIATTPTDLLASSLGCDKLAALQERRLAAIALKDHLHSRMPVAVDINNHKIIHLVIGDIGSPDPVVPADDVMTLTGEILSRGAVGDPHE